MLCHIARRINNTYDLIWADFTPSPAFPLSCFSDQVNLAIVENLVTVWGWDTRGVFPQGCVEGELVDVLENRDAVVLFQSGLLKT